MVWFEMVRSIWLPTNACMRITTVFTSAATACILTAVNRATGIDLQTLRGVTLACYGAFALEYTSLRVLRDAEAAALGLPSDVKADRAMSPLGFLSLPAAGFGLFAWLLAICLK
jgi:hypothetical protein